MLLTHNQAFSILNKIADFVFILDQDWRILFLNSQAQHLVQSDQQHPTLWQLYPEAIHTRLFYECQSVMRHRQAKSYEDYVVFLERWLEISIYPEDPGILICARDITERKRTMSALIASKRQAELANRMKNDFLGCMNHELRTPLNAILGFTNFLLSEVHNQPDRYGPFGDDLERIMQAGSHLQDLITDLLDLSKAESGHLALAYSHIDLSALIQEVIDIVTPIASATQNQIHYVEQCSIPSYYTDPLRLRQILYNLLSNACKFTQAGSITVSKTLSINDPDPMIKIAVTDTGIGMTSEDIAIIFQPFTQVHQSKSRSQEGTGIGLTISLRLAELLGGTISVTSQKGQGSTFTVSLPLSDGVVTPVGARETEHLAHH